MSTGLSESPLGPEWEAVGPAPPIATQQPSNALGPEWEAVPPDEAYAHTLNHPTKIREFAKKVFKEQALELPDGQVVPPSHYDRMAAASAMAKLPELDDAPPMQAAWAASEIMRSTFVTREPWMLAAGLKAKRAADAIAAGDTSSENYIAVAAFLEEEKKLGQQYTQMPWTQAISEGIGKSLQFASGVAAGAPVKAAVQQAVVGGSKGLARRAAGTVASEAARMAATPQLQSMVAKGVIERQAPEAMEAGGIVEGDPFTVALGKAAGSQVISQVTERMGGLLPLKAAIAKAAGRNPNSIRSVVEWDGLIGEFLEERYEDIAQGLFKAATGEDADFGTTGKLVSSDPEIRKQGLQDLATEAVVIGAVGSPAVISDIATARKRAERLEQLKEIRAKGWVSAEDAQLNGIPGETRKERLTNADAEIQQIEKEIEDAGPISGSQTEIREEPSGEDVRGSGQEQVPTEPAGEVAPAPEVQVGKQATRSAEELTQADLDLLFGSEVQVASPQADEPPLAAGMTRLYHGSAEHGRYEGPAWFSTNRTYAENYREGGELQYVDVPTALVNEQSDPDKYGNTPARGFTWNAELDSGITGPRKPLAPAETAQPTPAVEEKSRGVKPVEPAQPTESPTPVVDEAAQTELDLKAKYQQEVADWKRRTRRSGGRVADITRGGLQKAVNDALKRLGLNAQSDLSPKGIIDAYRRASRKAHPDRGGSAAAMSAINEAKEILINSPATLDLAKRKFMRERAPAAPKPTPQPTPATPAAQQPTPQPVEQTPTPPQAPEPAAAPEVQPEAVQEPTKAPEAKPKKSRGKKVPKPPQQDSGAAEAVQEAADASRPESQAYGLFGGGTVIRQRIRDDQIPAAIKAPQGEVERRMQAARGLRKPSLMSRITDTLRLAKHTLRAQEHLPANENFASANEFFRLFKAINAAAKDEAIRTTAAIVDPLGPKQLLLFERAAIVENQLAALQMGQPLRFGFSSEREVAQYRDQLQDAISKTPAVADAIEARRKIVREKVEQLVELDLLPEAALENTDVYFHQQVHFYMQSHRGGVGTPGKSRRTFQGRRLEGESFDEKYDYNTSYLEAEIAWLTDADIEIRKERLLQKLVKQYDVKGEMVKAAKEANLLAGNDDLTWRDMVRNNADVAIWQPEPGNHFYRAFSVPERIVEQIQREAFAEITAEDVGAVLAIGQPNRQFVLPVELVNQLQATKKAELPHGLTRLADEAMRAWKVWTLLSPKRILGYNLRNLTGDLDPVVTAVPGVFNHTGQAYGDLQKYHGSFLSLSANLRAARDLGVVGSGFAAEEVPDIADLPVFERFFRSSNQKTGLKQLPKAYFDKVKQFTEFRENALRYATYLAYLEQVRSGKVSHYGGANKAVVDALAREMGSEEAAAHLARQLLGDYGNISVAGNWLRRRLMPFWSFQEINLRRTPQLVVNAWDAGGTGAAAKAMGKAAARTILTSRIAWMFGALWVWNHLIQGGDEEDELGPHDRANPHIILGRNPDGSIRNFRNVGALGDFLEWFGLNEALALIPKIKSGQVTLDELATEMAMAPIEKVFGSLRPEVGALAEGAAGVSLFPEPFSPRAVRRDEAVPNALGLADEYKLAKGLILQDGSRPRDHYWQRWMLGVSDPRKNALSEMYDLRNRFLKTKGQQEKGIFPVSQYKEARDAAQNEDFAAFQEWKNTFVEKQGAGSREGFKGFLDRLDPVASRLSQKDEVEFEQEFLTGEQRQKLQVARQYSAELRGVLLNWWDATEQSSLKDEVVASTAFSIARIDRPNAEQTEEIKRKVEELRTFDMDEQRLVSLLNDKLRRQGVRAEGRKRWIGDLRRRLKAE